MTVADVFQYDERLNFLHWKNPTDPSLSPFERTPPTLFRALSSGKLQLQPYFAPVCRPTFFVDAGVSFAPLSSQFCLHGQQSLITAQATAKTFRLTVLASVVPPVALRQISSSSWRFFWALSLTAVQRNVLFRFILGCITNKRFLHRILPAIFVSPLCPVCLTQNDSPSHLLFHCPPKERVWQGIITEFLWPTTSVVDIKHALQHLNFSDIQYCRVSGIKPFKIILIALGQLWLAHMRFIFDNAPINPLTILASIRSNVRQTIEEDQCHRLL